MPRQTKREKALDQLNSGTPAPYAKQILQYVTDDEKIKAIGMLRRQHYPEIGLAEAKKLIEALK